MTAAVNYVRGMRREQQQQQQPKQAAKNQGYWKRNCVRAASLAGSYLLSSRHRGWGGKVFITAYLTLQVCCKTASNKWVKNNSKNNDREKLLKMSQATALNRR